jgi:hypothetical protein
MKKKSPHKYKLTEDRIFSRGGRIFKESAEERERVYKTKKMLHKDLEKHFNVKLTNEEYVVIKDFAFNDHEKIVGDENKFYPFDKYVLSIKQWGTKSGACRKRAKYFPDDGLFRSFGAPSGFGLETTGRIFDFNFGNMEEIYISIQEEIDNRYPKLEKKREAIREKNKQTLKENKKSYSGPDPDLIIGLVVFVFLTWLIFGVIFGGSDLSPGGPKFFGHDGG